ncbi:MAG: FKBP-type peptidyl-prolyl cis-trans isomerase [Nitrosomonas sp.]|jgi:FKBP-type peptidyl-prolyl cis-trans isomerase FkpA|uniref:FKBP-type peptidyl-prolyl cis-trans isomerase n=1 Tax=Nitrosomonas sp. TaxID=42353 RepID=UPI001E015808|nr:FKBP-type peptidyl-prolyl cis-trans isomerase [Nitrosomonas sp.]MBX9893650.1 FKBP-type peptidyl-prolyl cis-trans isomerase [Nitrosomonas sp.]
MKKTKTLLNFMIILLALAIPQAAFSYKDSASNSADDPAFQKIDTKVGTGEEAEIGKTVNVHYTGWLYDEDAPNKKGPKFDSSHDRKDHFSFMLGAGRVIKGWDKGVQGMKVGGQRTLIIPPSMAYGSRGAGNIIPPDATLIFEVELIGLKSGAYH